MKFIYTWLLISLGMLMSTTTLSTQTLVSWSLTAGSPGTPQVHIPEVTGIPFTRGNGLSALTFSGAGVNATSWSMLSAADNQVDYYEFGLTAGANKTIHLTGISFNERRAEDGPRTMLLAYSRDAFATQVELVEIALPDDLALRSHSFFLDLKIQDGENLHFRIYGLDAESEEGMWLIQSNTLELTGESMAPCTDPSNTAQLALISQTASTATVQMTAGNGQARLLCMAPAGAVISRPYQGETYTGNLSYGAGDQLGKNAFVVATTTAAQQQFEITNLEPGKHYQVTVIEYNNSELCYANEQTHLSFGTFCPTIPPTVDEIHYTSLDAQVAIRWEQLPCIEHYLVVGSETPISGTPIGEDFAADPSFGDGDLVAGLSGNTYALYNTVSFYNEVLVTNLENGTPYYFAIYTLRNGQWSVGKMFDSQPEEACTGLEPERIFINEIHYANGPVSQDQGVEIAGPAGIDLSNYELVISRRSGSINGPFTEMYRYPLYGLIDDEAEGMGAVWFPLSPMDESRGRIQLVNTVTGQSVDMVIYEVNQGVQHQAALYGGGQGNSGAGLWESNTDPAGYSLQLTGEGTCAGDFSWARLEHTRGFLNLGQAVLPVELNFLAAEPVGKIARIFWQTATESGSDYFLVEHSSDGRTFTEIGAVAAAGFSNVTKDYEFYDNHPADGLNYYRLRQADYDGQVHDEGIVTVRFADSAGPLLTVFPNPVSNQATVSWNFPKAIAIHLLDAQGRTLIQWTLDETVEGGSRTLDLGSYPSGMYLLRIQGARDSEIQRLVKN